MGCTDKPGNRIQLDIPIGPDEAGTELDGRNVSFTGSSQAYDKTQSSVGYAGLVGMWNDGWIEERSGFQRVLSGKKSAYEKSARKRKGLLGTDVRQHPLVIRHQGRLDIQMAGTEFLQQGIQGTHNLFLADGKSPIQYGRGMLCAG